MFDAPRLPSTITPDALVDPPGSARMWLPRLSLAQCVKCVMVRDTRQLPGGMQQSLTHLPASPCCTITWLLDGEVEEQMPVAKARYTGLVFSGPYRQPSSFRYLRPVHGLMLALLPDAFTALTGVDPSPWIDRSVPVQEVLSSTPWLMSLCRAVNEAESDDARVTLIERVLDARWQDLRPPSRLGASGHLFDDWAQGLSLRAANTGLGRSVRQFERRIKQWTGQPLRELRGLGRSERAFFEAVLAEEQGKLNWAEVADGSGYTDQSHLCRQTRRLTGFAPDELRRLIREDEGFWAYRLWGFSEARPGRS